MKLSLKNNVRLELQHMINELQQLQASDGSWRFCFESGALSDAYMIILLKSLDLGDELLVRQLVERITRKQQENGAWKLYEDEAGGHLSSTIEAYYALLYSGYFKIENENMLRAKQFILSQGGIEQAHLLTKTILSITGQYQWEKHFQIPIEFILLPTTLPISFFDIVGYARVHLAPILILVSLRYSNHSSKTPDLSDLYTDRFIMSDSRSQDTEQAYRSFLESISNYINRIKVIPKYVKSIAYDRAKRFMLDRIEPDGTLYSYSSATILMVYALIALGYPKNDPVIINAIKGLKSLLCKPDDYLHIQNPTSTVWDTSLLCYALQEAALEPYSSTIQRANQYILSRQHSLYGDWALRIPEVPPGGWGFSDINTLEPDVDDTTAALRAICRMAMKDETALKAWDRGINWILSLQNEDGGWPAFERSLDKDWLLTFIPFDPADRFFDPSSADLTGRTLEFFGNYTAINPTHPTIQKGVNWLISNQEENGSWFGRWGINYIYGTWAAISGMMAVGVNSDSPSLQQAAYWLESIQNDDGGWGESCYSDIVKEYVPLGASTPSQSAWAIEALLYVHKQPTPSIQKGIEYLLKARKQIDWTTAYPTGAGLPGIFYTRYHSYNYVWPLLTFKRFLSHGECV